MVSANHRAKAATGSVSVHGLILVPLQLQDRNRYRARRPFINPLSRQMPWADREIKDGEVFARASRSCKQAGEETGFQVCVWGLSWRD